MDCCSCDRHDCAVDRVKSCIHRPLKLRSQRRPRTRKPSKHWSNVQGTLLRQVMHATMRPALSTWTVVSTCRQTVIPVRLCSRDAVVSIHTPHFASLACHTSKELCTFTTHGNCKTIMGDGHVLYGTGVVVVVFIAHAAVFNLHFVCVCFFCR